MTERQQLLKRVIERPSPKALLALYEYDTKELEQKIRKVRVFGDLRHCQGQLHIVDELVELLKKVV